MTAHLEQRRHVRHAPPRRGEGRQRAGRARRGGGDDLGLYPIVTFQYSSTTFLHQFSYHIRTLLF